MSFWNKKHTCDVCSQMIGETPYRSSEIPLHTKDQSRIESIIKAIPNTFKLYKTKILYMALFGVIAFTIVEESPIGRLFLIRLFSGLLAIVLGVLGFCIAMWLLFPGLHRLGWRIGSSLKLFINPYTEDEYGPVPWLFGVFAVAIPIGAYYVSYLWM